MRKSLVTLVLLTMLAASFVVAVESLIVTTAGEMANEMEIPTSEYDLGLPTDQDRDIDIPEGYTVSENFNIDPAASQIMVLF